jgi:hypothetical protein
MEEGGGEANNRRMEKRGAGVKRRWKTLFPLCPFMKRGRSLEKKGFCDNNPKIF